MATIRASKTEGRIQNCSENDFYIFFLICLWMLRDYLFVQPSALKFCRIVFFFSNIYVVNHWNRNKTLPTELDSSIKYLSSISQQWNYRTFNLANLKVLNCLLFLSFLFFFSSQFCRGSLEIYFNLIIFDRPTVPNRMKL